MSRKQPYTPALEKQRVLETSDLLVSNADRPAIMLSSKWRIAISLGVIVHLAAVAAEPFRFFTRTSERFAAADSGLLRRALSPYVDAMYLSHGYFFFAPNPGPSHLIEAYDVADPRQKITFPDRYDQWPRLLYHRHFMMSEFYNTLFAPDAIETPRDDRDAAAATEIEKQWREDRLRYEQLQNSIRANVKSKLHADEVGLHRLQHELPIIPHVLDEKWKLTDDRLYSELMEGPRKPDPVIPNANRTPERSDDSQRVLDLQREEVSR